jgi:hypothetical protein
MAFPYMHTIHFDHNISKSFLFYHLYIYSCVYIVWATSPPHPPRFWPEPVLPSCSSILLKRKYKR